jgi:hypothetical protein
MTTSSDGSPIKATEDTDPWEPTISSSDTSDQETAETNYQDIYGAGNGSGSGDSGSSGTGTSSTEVPVLSMAYTTAPDLLPSLPAASAGSGGGAADSSEFFIYLGALRTAEQSVLDATSAATESYNTLKKVVQNAIYGGSDPFGQFSQND